MWLSDSRRLLFQYDGKVFLIDSRTGKTGEILSVTPHTIDFVALCRDDKTMYFDAKVHAAQPNTCI